MRIITLATLLTAAVAAHAADSSFDRTLSTSASPDLYVSTGSGNIRIHSGGSGQIHIQGHVHAGWNAYGDVNGRIKQICDNPPVVQNGNALHVGETHDNPLYRDIAIDYEITVPAETALNLHSGSGEIETDAIGRFVSASSGSGNIRAHQVHGPADLQTGSGDIEFEQSGAGDVKARTGSGSIRAHQINGSFNAKTGSGDVEVDGRVHGPSTVTTGSGSVRFHINRDARFNFEATTGSGTIRLHFPSTNNSESNRHYVSAAVNGGGDPLTIHTGSGDVEVDGQ